MVHSGQNTTVSVHKRRGLLTCAIVFDDQPMKKYMTRIPSDMTKNINEMKLPRATILGDVKTLMTLPSKRACPGLTAAARDIMVSKSKEECHILGGLS